MRSRTAKDSNSKSEQYLKPKQKIPFSIIFTVIILAGFCALFYMLKVSFNGWIIMCSMFLAVFLLSLVNKMKTFLYTSALAMVIILSCISLDLYRADQNLSLRGNIARETVRHIMHLRIMDSNNFFDLGAQLNGKGFDWNPPLGYDNTVYQVEKAELELLKNKKSKSDKLILHIHGGGYILPLSKNYRDISVELSKRSGEKAQIANLNYRVYPKTYPSALDDAFASWLWLLKNDYNPKNIIIVGDSAGGNLTLALTAKLRDEGYALPKAIICISACSDYTLAGDSFTYNLYKDPMFGLLKGQPPEDVVKKFSPVYPGKADTKDPYLSPLFGSLEGFPDMLLLVGTHEMLESDSINIHQKAISQGVNSKLIRYEGMFHSWQFFGDLIPESEAAWNDIEKFIQSQYKD